MMPSTGRRCERSVRPDCASGSATDHSVNGPVIVAAASQSALDLQNQRDILAVRSGLPIRDLPVINLPLINLPFITVVISVVVGVVTVIPVAVVVIRESPSKSVVGVSAHENDVPTSVVMTVVIVITAAMPIACTRVTCSRTRVTCSRARVTCAYLRNLLAYLRNLLAYLRNLLAYLRNLFAYLRNLLAYRCSLTGIRRNPTGNPQSLHVTRRKSRRNNRHLDRTPL